MKIYALQAVDAGWEDAEAISFDLDRLIEWTLKQGYDYPVYIVEGKELAPGIFQAKYTDDIVWEWNPEDKS